MISIQQRLFLTDQSKKEGSKYEPLRPISEEEFIALSKSEEFLNRAKKVEDLAKDWWAETDEALRKELREIRKEEIEALPVGKSEGRAADVLYGSPDPKRK